MHVLDDLLVSRLVLQKVAKTVSYWVGDLVYLSVTYTAVGSVDQRAYKTDQLLVEPTEFDLAEGWGEVQEGK